MKIQDGKGKGVEASVSKDGRLDTSARTNLRKFYISRDDGESYHFTSKFDATTGAVLSSGS